jgi:hypothetical protein
MIDMEWKIIFKRGLIISMLFLLSCGDDSQSGGNSRDTDSVQGTDGVDSSDDTSQEGFTDTSVDSSSDSLADTSDNGNSDTDSLDTEPVDTSMPNGETGVYFEVESIEPVFPWVEETVYDNYLGSSYFRWPDVADNQHGITNSQDAVLVYDFSIGESGTYLFEIRGRRDHEGWCVDAANDACNDLWVKIDDGDWTKKMIKQGTWGEWIWDPKWEPGSNVITTEVYLDAQNHTYSISGRSNGVKIDAVRIYRKGTTPPVP